MEWAVSLNFSLVYGILVMVTLEHDRELAELLAELEAKSRLMDDIDVAPSASISQKGT